jgi:hypothetical protein
MVKVSLQHQGWAQAFSLASNSGNRTKHGYWLHQKKLQGIAGPWVFPANMMIS